jgi:uncharacterized protein YbjT (DUF2867 family)
VRAVVRDAARGTAWAGRGCEVALADMGDAAALGRAFAGAEGVFVLLPPNFDPAPGYAESRALVAALREALAAAQPARVVCLSTIGAQATQDNLLSQLGMLERELGTLPVPVAFLRTAWFMENAAWDVATARDQGVLPSFLQPLERPVPMVSVADVGRAAAELLQEDWQGRRVVELEGPRPVAPADLAAAFGRLLGREVKAQAVPRGEWEALFRAQGMHHPQPRMRMLDGFNEGWIAFEDPARARKGRVGLEDALRTLVERA